MFYSMCNQWTNEHIWLWTSSTTSAVEIPIGQQCSCGKFLYQGNGVDPIPSNVVAYQGETKQ